VIEIIDEIDLFAFREYEDKGRKTNIFQETLLLGIDPILDNMVQEGVYNLRAMLRKNNQFEIENDIS
jgi:hypothetical protein